LAEVGEIESRASAQEFSLTLLGHPFGGPVTVITGANCLITSTIRTTSVTARHPIRVES